MVYKTLLWFIKPRCNEFAALLRPVAAPGCAALPCTPWPSVLIIPTISSLIHTLWWLAGHSESAIGVEVFPAVSKSKSRISTIISISHTLPTSTCCSIASVLMLGCDLQAFQLTAASEAVEEPQFVQHIVKPRVTQRRCYCSWLSTSVLGGCIKTLITNAWHSPCKTNGS